MARTVGSKNKNSNSLSMTKLFQEYWSSPDKMQVLNDKLWSIVIEGGTRDSLAAINLIYSKGVISADKQLESDTAVNTLSSKNEVLDAINRLREKNIESK